jgi:hypothetical protein
MFHGETAHLQPQLDPNCELILKDGSASGLEYGLVNFSKHQEFTRQIKIPIKTAISLFNCMNIIIAIVVAVTCINPQLSTRIYRII